MNQQDIAMKMISGMNNNAFSSKGMGGLIHLAAWMVLFCLPLFFTGNQTESVTWIAYLRFIIVPLSFMILFYFNYFYLVDRFIFTKQFVWFLLSNICVIVVLMYSVHFLMHILPAPVNRPGPPEREWHDVVRFFIGNTIIYMLVAALSVAIKMTGSWYRAESAQKELQKSRSEAELQNLKSQLNPHFLFNTLNNIYSLIAISPEKAQESVHDLSRLLRYVLYDSSYSEVPLGKEIDFIHNYIELMRIRLPEKVEVSVNTAPLVKNETMIAPLLFISLIENAFKHGVSNTYPSFISVEISQDEEYLNCLIRNSYFPKDNERDKSGSGIGLVNLRKRLELLYPNRAEFYCSHGDGVYSANLKIRLTD